MQEDDFSIENNLKNFRKRHNLSQEQLAKELGISRQSIISLEQGRSMPSLPLVVSLCRFFNSSFEEIFNFEDEFNNEVNQIIESNTINDRQEKPDRFNPGRKENNMPNELEPWRPFREMVSLRDAMDRLFEDSVITSKTTGATVMPKIDIKDKKDSIVVRAELPGIEEEDVDIEITDDIMTISGERKEEKEKDEEGYYYKESHTGSFSRSFTLPSNVMGENAKAEMKKGVLTVTIPKVESKKATKIKVAKK